MPTRTWEIMRPALFEATFVVLGVVLALGANEWREGHQQRRQAQAALAEITAELEANRAAVARSFRYHGTLLDTLRTHRGDAPPSIRVFGRGFIAPAQVYRTAWSSAAETGALSHMPYADVLRLSRAYAMQDAYTEQTHSAAQIIYGELYHGGSASILANYRNLAGVISTFAYREQELLAAYDSTLAGVGVRTGAAPGGSDP